MSSRSGSERETGVGQEFPLGATLSPAGVNFSVFSKKAKRIEVLLFRNADDAEPARIIPLDPGVNRTYHYWHAFVPGIGAGQLYALRAQGPFEPEKGHRFDGGKVLLDPYGRALVKPKGWTRAAALAGEDTSAAMKNGVVDLSRYDWEGDKPLRRPFTRTIIYEMHVGGFTRNPNSGVIPEKRGTYAGVIEKIPYLQDLGVTAVELLPVYHFNEEDAPEGLANYWGYNPVSFFVPHGGYSSRKGLLGPLDEFRDMVKALHRAGIEVILDVVYNHTAEGDHEGPTLCFRGLANDTYYILGKDKASYSNYSGCGNTLNAGHAVVRRMILDSLRYWVSEMHVDGFRFDLASVLTRDGNGIPLANPPVLSDIESDPVLVGTKLIAEAWDAAGLYQVGTFPGDSWKEWNGRFRDDVRRFLRADKGSVSAFASRMLGSPDIYGPQEREAERSINFATCHDGFTLNDLVSYDHKHNEPNGEGNRDGASVNHSWNCGAEGPTDDLEIESLRTRQVKNFLAITLLSVGTPMLLMGDEVRRTQCGNNNAYCQDNETSWFDWSQLEKHSGLTRFVRQLISTRLRRDAAEEDEVTLNELLRRGQIQWHGVRLHQPDWADDSHSLAFTARSIKGRFLIHAMVNSYWEALVFDVPTEGGGPASGWRRWIDTSLPSPEDICEWRNAPGVTGRNYRVEARSVAVLVARLSRADGDREGP